MDRLLTGRKEAPAEDGPPDLGGFVLRPYQVDAVGRLRDNMRRGVRRQVLSAPTGSGKTVIAMAMVKAAAERGKRVAFVCDRISLVDQTSERFAQAGIRHGMVMSDRTAGAGMQVVVCSAQTLESRGVGEYDLVVIDECHELRRKLLAGIHEDAWTIGLSATPMAQGMGEHYGAVVNIASTNALIRDGFLVPLRVIAPETAVDVTGLAPTSTGEWAREAVGERALRIVGDVVAEWERVCREMFGGHEQPTIAFGASVADCEAMAERFRAAGHPFEAVTYKRGADENQDAIRRYRLGELRGLVSCMSLSRGFDVPETAILIDCYPLRKSLVTALQRLGRVMRPADGKRDGVLIDHACIASDQRVLTQSWSRCNLQRAPVGFTMGRHCMGHARRCASCRKTASHRVRRTRRNPRPPRMDCAGLGGLSVGGGRRGRNCGDRNWSARGTAR